MKKNTNTIMQQISLLFPSHEIRRILYTRSRGRRSINLLRCVLFISFTVLILIIVYVNSLIHTYNDYQDFIKIHPFSTVPFWKDNRTINQKPLLPVFKIEDINLSNATIAIVACCRNVRRYLQGFQRNIAAITALFGHYRIYLCESDSDDSTLQFLKEWQKNDTEHVRVRSEGEQSQYISARTARLALCRNTLLQQARNELPSLDYYFVMDVDVGSSPSFQVKDFLTNFLYPSSSWIAMTATQRSEYYDIWALRLEPVIPYDCWTIIEQFSSLIVSRSFLIKHIVTIHQAPIPRNHSLIEVQSAFGGAALYNAKYLDKRCLYNGTVGRSYWSTYEMCEHVPFHQCLRHYATEQSLYINPQFQIC